MTTTDLLATIDSKEFANSAETTDWASLILTELAKHEVNWVEGDGRGITAFRCNCGHEGTAPHEDGYFEHLEPFYAHRDTAAAASAAALIRNLVSP